MTIGERIQAYRKQKGLSQEELAKQLLVSRQTISLWETDQTLPTVENLIRLKDIFGVPVDDILTEPNTEDTDAPLPIETYSFKYTAEILKSLNFIDKQISKNSIGKSIIIFFVLIFLSLILSIAEGEVSGVLIGIIIAVVFFIVLSVIIFFKGKKVSKDAERKVLQSIYTYYVYDSFIKVEIFRDNAIISEKYVYPQTISKFWDTGNLFVFEWENQIYTLDRKDIPNEAYFFSFFRSAQTEKIKTKEALKLKTAGNVFFVLSLFIFP